MGSSRRPTSQDKQSVSPCRAPQMIATKSTTDKIVYTSMSVKDLMFYGLLKCQTQLAGRKKTAEPCNHLLLGSAETAVGLTIIMHTG